MPDKPKFLLRECTKCHHSYGPESYLISRSWYHPDGILPICTNCLIDHLSKKKFNWQEVDRLCQWANIPFIPREWERLRAMNECNALLVYFDIFNDEEYESLGWSDYFKQFKALREAGVVEDELPELRERKFRDFRRKWGSNYDDEELLYLEDLYVGLTVSQNISGALQVDQAKKLCKLSLEIDSRIRSGDKDVDKILSSYDKVIKTAEFTPKNTKNATDFDSIGELALWLEKRGFVNKYYDGTTRDVIDETLKNIQSYNQRLYVNESSIGEEISARIKALNAPEDYDNFYDTNKEYDLDEYEVEIFKEQEEEEFEI